VRALVAQAVALLVVQVLLLREVKPELQVALLLREVKPGLEVALLLREVKPELEAYADDGWRNSKCRHIKREGLPMRRSRPGIPLGILRGNLCCGIPEKSLKCFLRADKF